jgi:hypothetical protein
MFQGAGCEVHGREGGGGGAGKVLTRSKCGPFGLCVGGSVEMCCGLAGLSLCDPTTPPPHARSHSCQTRKSFSHSKVCDIVWFASRSRAARDLLGKGRGALCFWKGRTLKKGCGSTAALCPRGHPLAFPNPSPLLATPCIKSVYDVGFLWLDGQSP